METSVEDTIKRLGSHPGVVGVLVINSDGIPVRSTLEPELSVHYAGLVSTFASKARGIVRRLDATKGDELQCVRIRSRRHELVVAPDYERGQEFTLVVVQDPAAAASAAPAVGAGGGIFAGGNLGGGAQGAAEAAAGAGAAPGMGEAAAAAGGGATAAVPLA